MAIRASESTEGRARLNRKANACDRAASSLRRAARTRVAPLIGVSPRDAHSRSVLPPRSVGTPRPCPWLHQRTALRPGPLRGGHVRTSGRPTRLPRKRGPNLMSAPPPVSVGTTRTVSGDDAARTSLEALRSQIAMAVVGQDPAVTGRVVALLCRGHVLLVGVPGVAKTLLVRALAVSLEHNTKRVQFTPGLMPSDVTGRSSTTPAPPSSPSSRAPYSPTSSSPTRSTGRPQNPVIPSGSGGGTPVTVDGTPRSLPDPFLVAATQNPVGYEGTCPLPEAQLGRFLLRLTVPLPARENEINVLTRHADSFDPRDLKAAGIQPVVAGPVDLEASRHAVARTTVSPELFGYVVDICRATRDPPQSRSVSRPEEPPHCCPPSEPGPGSPATTM